MLCRRSTRLALLATLLAACDREAQSPRDYDASVPVPEVEFVDSATLERARADTTWRRHADDDRRARLREHAPPRATPPDGLAAPPDGAPTTPPPTDGRPGDPGTNLPPPPPPPPRPEPAAVPPQPLPQRPALVPDGVPILRVQVLLDRLDFSPGAIDGSWGQNTEKAVYWFQHEHGLEPTGRVDEATYARLEREAGKPATLGRYEIREEDVDGPFRDVPPGIYQKAGLDCLCYESALELLAERFHVTPGLLRRLNPDVDFDALGAGDGIIVPNVRPRGGDDPHDVARIVISKGGSYLHALDADGRIVLHLPSTLGSRYSPSPEGDFQVAALVAWPRFHYTPWLYHDVPDERPDTVLPPGPNSPIGGTWIQLTARYYGIHGTAEPATIGYVTSHGCVRLTNWDAYALARAVRPDTPVEFR